MSSHDPVNHPEHYTAHPSGVECIQITEHMGFNLGNAVKYLWRADEKDGGARALEDLKKAAWYIKRELYRRDGAVDAHAQRIDRFQTELHRTAAYYGFPLRDDHALWMAERLAEVGTPTGQEQPAS